MKKQRLTESQIIQILKQAEGGGLWLIDVVSMG